MTFTHGTAGAANRSSGVRGDVAIISGTWRSAGLSSGTIVTGASTILGYNVSIGSTIISGVTAVPPFGSAMILTEKNKGGSGSSQEGSIRVYALDETNEMAGDWWAVARL